MNAKKLARQLYNDDLERTPEVPIQADGHRAYDTWLACASDSNDADTREALEAVDRDEFAAAWTALVEADADPSPSCNCGTCSPGNVTCVRGD